MPISNGIYYQQQQGGLCRMHALNAYFGKDEISIEQFNKYQQEYDNKYRDKFNVSDTSCKNFDIVMSDQKNIIAYILNTRGIYTRYYALNQLCQINPITRKEIINQIDGDFIFIYNESHIYGARRINANWYVVDSMRGVSLINIDTTLQTKNLGFIIPVNIKSEFYRNLQIIKDMLQHQNDKQQLVEIEDYLIRQHNEKKILGDLEIPLGICMDVMETNLANKTNDEISKFAPIEKWVLSYNEFLSQFTNGRYNDIDLIMQYLPEIINKIIQLSC